MSDIKFVGENVHIEGNVLKVTCFDIELDNAGRRSSAAGKRRAFVHDFQDGLTLNWAQDYPGGITLNGKVSVGELRGDHLRCSHHDLHLDNASRRTATTGSRRALVHDFQDGLTVNWARDYPGGVTINGDVKMPNGATVGLLQGTTLRLTHHTLYLDHAARRAPATALTRKTQRRALMHDTTDGLTMNYAKDYPGGVTIRGTVRTPDGLLVKGQDVLQLIADLQSQVAALTARVEALESAT